MSNIPPSSDNEELENEREAEEPSEEIANRGVGENDEADNNQEENGEVNEENAERQIPGNWGNVLRFFNNIFPNYQIELNNEDEDENDEDMFEDEEGENNEEDEYENAGSPESINYDTALPSTHNYLGANFQEVSAPKTIRAQNDEITLPLLLMPNNESTLRFNHRSTNDIQLLPGQVMPLYFYSPIQINMIQKRMKEPEPTIGFALTSKTFRSLTQQNENNLSNDEMRLGVLAEIISCRDESDTETGFGLMNGLILKVKGRERFKILKVRKDITGIFLADVKILPDIVFDTNPLIYNCPKNSRVFYEAFFDGRTCSIGKAEMLNVSQAMPAWLYRKFHCGYTMGLIEKELSEWFKKKTPIDEANKENYKDPLVFSNWLLNNFPFDEEMRVECLKLDCVNQRLIQMYSLLKSFTNINCRECGAQLCSKSDVFSICEQGFMSPFLNPAGFVHETLTVFKIKNFRLAREPPDTEHTWFPGYGWQICSCKNCHAHIGWKFTSTKPELRPEKFFGLTRKSLCHTYNKETVNVVTD